MERVVVDGRGFRLAESGRPWTPWGFNYDHDDAGRLLEDYWEAEWGRVVEDFREMRALGATVVRIHLQLPRFMRSPDEPNGENLARLEKLLRLAEETGLRLDLTGLGTYRKSEWPAWYESAGERERWAIQARFWEAVAGRCAGSPAVYCYSLMNEPVSPSGPQKEWTAGPFGGEGGFHYVERITRDPAGRTREQVTRDWVAALAAGIRRRDPGRLLSAGLFYIFEVPGGLTLGADPRAFAEGLDFLNVHFYPKEGKAAESLDLLKRLDVGKPIVIEELAPLNCTMETFDAFMKGSRGVASGWIGFYWGKTLDECRRSGAFKDAFLASWLDWFLRSRPLFLP
jgi:hypothetical protein